MTFPLLVVFVLVGVLKNENNAVTWFAINSQRVAIAFGADCPIGQ